MKERPPQLATARDIECLLIAKTNIVRKPNVRKAPYTLAPKVNLPSLIIFLKTKYPPRQNIIGKKPRKKYRK